MDRFKLDEQVELLVQALDEQQGFQAEGWFKPASDEEGTAVEKKYISSLSPEP